MAAVPAALLIGVLVGARLRPVLDAYINWRTARFYADLSLPDEVLCDESLVREATP